MTQSNGQSIGLRKKSVWLKNVMRYSIKDIMALLI